MVWDWIVSPLYQRRNKALISNRSSLNGPRNLWQIQVDILPATWKVSHWNVKISSYIVLCYILPVKPVSREARLATTSNNVKLFLAQWHLASLHLCRFIVTLSSALPKSQLQLISTVYMKPIPPPFPETMPACITSDSNYAMHRSLETLRGWIAWRLSPSSSV